LIEKRFREVVKVLVKNTSKEKTVNIRYKNLDVYMIFLKCIEGERKSSMDCKQNLYSHKKLVDW
jgi:hypothetical protein